MWGSEKHQPIQDRCRARFSRPGIDIRKTGLYFCNAGRVIDPLIEDLVREEAWFAKIPQRTISDGECVARITMALLAASLNLQDSGAEAEAIDSTARIALGYPAPWGGPLYHLRHADKAHLARLAALCDHPALARSLGGPT